MATQKNELMQLKILECAKVLFKEYGYTKTSIRMICKEIGFRNQASFYMYFTSKEELASRIMQEYFRKVEKFISNVGGSNKNALVILLLRELIGCQVQKDPVQRRFFTEFQQTQTLRSMSEQVPEFVNLIDEKVQAFSSKLSIEEMRVYMFYYISGFSSVLRSIDNQESKVTADEVIDELPSIFLELLKIDYELRQNIIDRAKELFSSISDKDYINIL
ncbi:MAG: TetR/AcrR family transcriptional regulator [Anaerofustis sp.]